MSKNLRKSGRLDARVNLFSAKNGWISGAHPPCCFAYAMVCNELLTLRRES